MSLCAISGQTKVVFPGHLTPEGYGNWRPGQMNYNNLTTITEAWLLYKDYFPHSEAYARKLRRHQPASLSRYRLFIPGRIATDVPGLITSMVSLQS